MEELKPLKFLFWFFTKKEKQNLPSEDIFRIHRYALVVWTIRLCWKCQMVGTKTRHLKKIIAIEYLTKTLGEKMLEGLVKKIEIEKDL